MNILIKNQSGYEYNLEKFKVSTTKKTMKIPFSLNGNEKSRYRAQSSLSQQTRNPRLTNSIKDTYLVYQDNPLSSIGSKKSSVFGNGKIIPNPM